MTRMNALDSSLLFPRLFSRKIDRSDAPWFPHYSLRKEIIPLNGRMHAPYFFLPSPYVRYGKVSGADRRGILRIFGLEKIMHFFRTFCGRSFFPSSSCRRSCCCCIRFECCIVTPFPRESIPLTPKEARKKLDRREEEYSSRKVTCKSKVRRGNRKWGGRIALFCGVISQICILFNTFTGFRL